MAPERAPRDSRSASATWLRIALAFFLALGCSREESSPSPVSPAHAQGFRPWIERVEFTPASVRPGDMVSCVMHFENRGDSPGPADYSTFVHFEPVGGGFCDRIAFQDDRMPLLSTRFWAPGARVEVGPRLLRVPADVEEGEYVVHAGLYEKGKPRRSFGGRFAGTLHVARGASPSSEWQPQPLPSEELASRRARLAQRLAAPVVLEGEGWSYAQDSVSGAFLLTDRRTGAQWSSNTASARWGVLRLTGPDGWRELPLERFDALQRGERGLSGVIEPRIDGKPIGVRVEVDFELGAEGRALVVRCRTESVGPWKVQALDALDRALFVTDAGQGYIVLPRQLGYLLPAERGLPHERRYLTYDDTSMPMVGAVQAGSAILIAWEDADVAVRTHVSCEDSPLVPGRRTQCVTLELAEGTGEFQIRPLGAGGYVEIAAGYRDVARERGLLVPLSVKRARAPRGALLAGAPIFRACALARTKPKSLFNPGDRETALVRYRFDEIAQLAEHWRRDLDLDRALVVVTGWNRCGYDNELPDTLPANSECGGDAELAACSRRVQACGFLFGLHDNLQDMYRDAPSWDETLIERDADGALRDAGLWEGGRCYRICSSRQDVFARRNWPQMRARFGLDLLFADTIFSVKLGECSASQHPVERRGDLANKQGLCALARESFELIGGEGGKDWGVTEVETFEGLLTYKTASDAARTVVPLFELVFGDCVNLFTMQEDRLDVADAKKVLDHALCAEMPQFAFGEHAYFAGPAERELAVVPEVASFEQVGPKRLRFRWRFRVGEDLPEDHVLFAHFRHPQSHRPDGISFQDDDFAPNPPTSTWRTGDVVEVGPRDIQVTENLEGEWEVLVGLERAGVRRHFAGIPSQRGRHKLGVLRQAGARWEFVPGGWPEESYAFARGDGGWGAELGATDRLIKNVFELLSPLARLTQDRPMSDHRFLRADRSVESSRFGDVAVTVNYGYEPFEIGDTLLPRYGVLVASPTFVAFYALRHAGVEYPGGALFTMRSLDEEPLEQSTRVRIFHGFGPARVRLGWRTLEVAREAVAEDG